MLQTRETTARPYSQSMGTPTHATRPTRWWHEAIIDDMLVNPGDSLTNRAKRLGYTPAYLSTLMNSDMFKAVYAKRRAAFNSALDEGIQNKVRQTADKALDMVMQVLDKKRDSIPFPALADFTDRTLERLGYGSKQSSGVQVNVNTA